MNLSHERHLEHFEARNFADNVLQPFVTDSCVHKQEGGEKEQGWCVSHVQFWWISLGSLRQGESSRAGSSLGFGVLHLGFGVSDSRWLCKRRNARANLIRRMQRTTTYVGDGLKRETSAANMHRRQNGGYHHRQRGSWTDLE